MFGFGPTCQCVSTTRAADSIEGRPGKAHRRPFFMLDMQLQVGQRKHAMRDRRFARKRHREDMHGIYLAGSVGFTCLCDVSDEGGEHVFHKLRTTAWRTCDMFVENAGGKADDTLRFTIYSCDTCGRFC